MLPADAFTRLVPCTIRDYTPEDREACLEVYHSNVPDPCPEAILPLCARFLDEGTSYLLVVEHEGRVAGCGGLELRGEGPFAHLFFGFLHKDWQGRGLGTTLLAARLSLIEHEGQDITVHLEAGTEAAGFFGRFGFKLGAVKANVLGPGRDVGHLVLQITPGEIDELGRRLAASGTVIELLTPEAGELEEELLDE